MFSHSDAIATWNTLGELQGRLIDIAAAGGIQDITKKRWGKVGRLLPFIHRDDFKAVPLEVFERRYGELRGKAEGTKQRVDGAGGERYVAKDRSVPDGDDQSSSIMPQKITKYRNRLARLVRPTSTERILLDQKLTEYKRERKKLTVQVVAKREVVGARIWENVDKYKRLPEIRLARIEARSHLRILITQRKSRIDEDGLRELHTKTHKKVEAQNNAHEKRLAGLLPEVRHEQRKSCVGDLWREKVEAEVDEQSDASLGEDHDTSNMQRSSDVWDKLRAKTDKCVRYREAVIERKVRSVFQKSQKQLLHSQHYTRAV